MDATGFLNEVEARVLGCLMEKEAATPEYYPLTLNALVNACNQKSNREPVVSYDEGTVEEAVESLRDKGLVVRSNEGRAAKYSHRLTEVYNFGRREQAVLCVLLLRGPQTPGELRSRTERMYGFDDLEGVEAALKRLMEWETTPLATRLARQPGSREARYAQLLTGEPVVPSTPDPVEPRGIYQAMEDLRQEVASLREELESLRRKWDR